MQRFFGNGFELEIIEKMLMDGTFDVTLYIISYSLSHSKFLRCVKELHFLLSIPMATITMTMFVKFVSSLKIPTFKIFSHYATDMSQVGINYHKDAVLLLETFHVC